MTRIHVHAFRKSAKNSANTSCMSLLYKIFSPYFTLVGVGQTRPSYDRNLPLCWLDPKNNQAGPLSEYLDHAKLEGFA